MYGNRTPRLPPIPLSDDSKFNVVEERLRRQEDTIQALLERAIRIKEDIVTGQEITRGTFMDERKNRQLLEDHIKVITAVCKKLNGDIEALENLLKESVYKSNTLDMRLRDMETSQISLNKDLQFKLSRSDTVINKLESENLNLLSAIKELQSQFYDFNRNVISRMHEIENRINEVNGKFDSVLTEQTMVLKTVEGDTVKQLQLLDGRTRTMLEDLRSQINMARANNDSDMARVESRLLQKIDESGKNNERYERLDRKLDDLITTSNQRHSKLEDDLHRQFTKLNSSTNKLEDKVYRGLDDKYSKVQMDYERTKRDLKAGFENVQDAIATLQKVVDGKIKLSEDKLEKEVDKIRKMVVLM